MTRQRINLSEWSKLTGRVQEVWLSPSGEVVVLGSPVSEDESHNCDANGCGQGHVLLRTRYSKAHAEGQEMEKYTRELAAIIGINPDEPGEQPVLAEVAYHVRNTMESHRRLAHQVVGLTKEREALKERVAELENGLVLREMANECRLTAEERDQLHATVSQLTRERDEAREAAGIDKWAGDIRLAAKFAKLAPRGDEFDSVLSLLNWCRANHDADSSARVWLERVVEITLRQKANL